jgi:hypothetical protein
LDFTRRATLVSFHLKALELINVYIDLDDFQIVAVCVNSAHVRNIDGLNSGCIDYWSVNSISVGGIIKCGSDS